MNEKANKQNYQLELEKVIKKLPDNQKRLFLHSCCAPCSSYCLEYLRKYFAVTIFYSHPGPGIVIGLIGVAMAVIRVLGGVHEVRDVVAGAVIGLVCGIVGFYICINILSIKV